MTPKSTIYEIAEKAGVSIATISRAVNPETQHKVAPETLRKINTLVQKCCYTPNLAARHLSKTAYKTIGVLFPHHTGILVSDYYSQILSGVADHLLTSDYRMKMILLKPEKPKWDRYDFKNGEGVDGLILTYWRTFFSDRSVFERLRIPCVVINNVEEDIRARFAAGDHFQGGWMAAEYLYSHGHRNIAVLSGVYGARDAKVRLNGFRSYLKTKGVSLDSNSIFDVNFEEEKAYEFSKKLLLTRSNLTAIFCMNDPQAFGVLKRLREMGIPCPGRISVMGYDDDHRSEHTEPPLTTIRVPVYQLAKQAAQDLIQYLQDKNSINFFKPCLLPVTLVERESVRKV